jgi:hypothetical protein
MQFEIALAEMAERMGPGQHSGLPCPKCADLSIDRALSMLVDPPHIAAICHRASCGFRYDNQRPGRGALEIRPSRARPYTGDMQLVDDTDLNWFSRRFHAPKSAFEHIRKSDGRYFLPILGPEGTRRGWVSRRPWDGSPLFEYMTGETASNVAPKSLTYMDNEEPVQDWHNMGDGPIVLVEDQISALRVVWDTYLSAVAILGTDVNQEKVAELQRYTTRILIALDGDATGNAFSIARKWGQAFNSCRIIILDKDIKDETSDVVRRIFSGT